MLVNVVCMALGVVMGRVMRRVSSRVLITAGLLVAAVALLSLLTLDADTSFWWVAWRPVLLGLGFGVAFPCITTVAVASVPPRQAGMAAAGNNAFRPVGGSPGAMSEAFLDGLHLCLLVSAALLVLAALAAAVLPSLDRKLLQALELDGRAPFSRIARVLGVSGHTIARRFRRLRITAGLRVTGMTDDGRLGRDSWIVRLGCTPSCSASSAPRASPRSAPTASCAPTSAARSAAFQPGRPRPLPHHRRPLHLPERKTGRPAGRPDSRNHPHPPPSKSPHLRPSLTVLGSVGGVAWGEGGEGAEGQRGGFGVGLHGDRGQ